MPRGDKSSYTGKQKRKAAHIEAGYEKRGTSHKEAERRAWATVNASDKGGKLGGKAAAKRLASARKASAKKAAKTSKRRGS